MHMKQRSSVKAYAFQVDNGFEVSWSDDWHAVPEYVPEHMISEFIEFCLSPKGANIDDVIIVLAQEVTQ